MDRPPSIVRFEQLYFISFALNLLAIALSWRVQEAALATNPQLAQIPWFLPVAAVVRIGIALLLWWFVARRGSVVAKWIVVVFAVFGGFGLLAALYGLVLGSLGPITALVSIASAALYIWAAVLLFRPDARLWFGEVPAEEPLA